MEIKSFKALKYEADITDHVVDFLTVEAALQIKINKKAYTITMRTPGNDLFLAVGLLYTEDIISAYSEILAVENTPDKVNNHNLIIDLTIDEKHIEGKNLFNRSIASSASCGVCGKVDLCDLVIPKTQISTNHIFSKSQLPILFKQMQQHQEQFKITGGSHAASIFSIEGELLSIQEDVGRHNAVDKAIGALLISEELSKAAILCISGRVSYEIVAKCARAGISFLIAVSAPSSLAVENCLKAGITLIAFCRGDKATVYTHDHRVSL